VYRFARINQCAADCEGIYWLWKRIGSLAKVPWAPFPGRLTIAQCCAYHVSLHCRLCSSSLQGLRWCSADVHVLRLWVPIAIPHWSVRINNVDRCKKLQFNFYSCEKFSWSFFPQWTTTATPLYNIPAPHTCVRLHAVATPLINTLPSIWVMQHKVDMYFRLDWKYLLLSLNMSLCL